MAPTLTSNSFLPKTFPNQRIKTNTTSHYRKNVIFVSVSAKQASEQGQKSQNSNPFQFDFTKLPDVKSLVPVITNPSTGLSFGNQRRKDTGTVFVAGAMGQVGIRIAQTLLRNGFAVRAGVMDLATAQELARIAAKYKIISNEESKRLNAVDSTFQDVESIAKSIGNASKVVVTIGPEENGPSSKVSTSEALQVIQAAKLANVDHVAIVYDDSTSNTSTYNVLDGFTMFFNNLFSKSQPLTLVEFLQKVVETDINYTLIKTNLTEDYSPEGSYNLVVSAEGSSGANDYKSNVTKSQIASLVADVFSDTAIAENKVVEVYTDPSAPLKPINELLRAIPEDRRRKAYAEALAKSQAEEEALRASEKARQAADAAKKLEEEVKKLKEEEARASSIVAEAEKRAEATIETILGRAKGVSSQISWEKLSSQFKTAIERTQQDDEEEPKVRVATVRGQAKARSLPSLKAVVKSPATKKQPAKGKEVRKKTAKDSTEESKRLETKKLFGGLFKQETIYIDED